MAQRFSKRIKKSLAKFWSNKPLVLVIIILLLASFHAGVSFERKEPTLLLMQQAVTGSLRPVNAASGTYVLTMIGVKPHTLIFTDHPRRTVGSWTNTDFITRWEKGTAILLSHSQTDGKEYAIALELSNPVFNAVGGWLTYQATVPGAAEPDGLAPSPDRHRETFPEILRSPALFIDGMTEGNL